MKTILILIVAVFISAMAWGQDYMVDITDATIGSLVPEKPDTITKYIKDIKCKDVPDSIVVSGKLWRGALILYDEWYNPYVAQEEVPCNCPEGTRAMWQSMVINASYPASRWYDCWSIKTVCDTIWADKINVWLTPEEYERLKLLLNIKPDTGVCEIFVKPLLYEDDTIWDY